MEKQKVFGILIVIIIAIFALILCVKLVFKSDSVNEGKFRVSDAILTSSAELTNKSKLNGVWSINVSQRNQISMLVTAATGSEIEKIYLTDISAVGNNRIVFSLLNNENKVILNEESKDIEVESSLDDNNQIKIEIVALNENVLKNWNIPTGINQITYDGKIFKTAGMSLKDLQFELKYKLVIVEKTGKVNTMKVDMVLPNEELMTGGMDIRRLSLSDFRFKVN